MKKEKKCISCGLTGDKKYQFKNLQINLNFNKKKKNSSQVINSNHRNCQKLSIFKASKIRMCLKGVNFS